MSTAAPTYHFEDFQVGDECRTMHRTVTESDLMTFVRLGGFFEEVFVNADFARDQSVFGTRVIPAQMVLVLAEGLYILTGRLHHGMAFLSLTELSVTAPTSCGDTLHAEVRVEQTRRTRKPGRGIVTTAHRVVNQRGETVMTYRTDRMVRSRSAD